MADRFGVPENAFGLVPEDFYGLVGRIVMLAALVDDRVLSLLWALDSAPQQEHSGKPTDAVVRMIRARLESWPKTVDDEGEVLLKRAEAALRMRHALAHSLWPNPTMEAAQGWRPLPRRKRASADPRDVVVWTRASEEMLVQAVGDLGNVTADLERFTQHIHSERARTIAYGQGGEEYAGRGL